MIEFKEVNQINLIGITDRSFVDIKGYEGLYKINKYGIVRNSKNEIKSTFIEFGGYVGILLYKNNQYKKFKIHRLVAEHFIPNPNNLPVINHKDGNRQNNHVDNLEWCTQSYNVKKGKRVEELRKPCKLYKFSTFIKEFPSIIDAAKYLNVTPACIFNSLKRNGYKESGAILRKYFIKV